MMWLPPTWIGPAVAAIGFALAGVQTVRLAMEQRDHVREVAAIHDTQREAQRMAQARANDAATRYEVWKAAQRPRIVTVIKEVDRALQAAPDWASQPLPDSVRDAINSARTLDPAAKPEPTVPPVGPRDASDQR